MAILTGCTTTVAGSAQQALRATPVRDLVTVLPSSVEVSQAVGNPVDADGPAVVGGVELLPNGIRDEKTARPIECLGPASPFMRVVYEPGGVRGAAWQEFANYGGDQVVSSVDAGVVQFDSEPAADRMFSNFAARWKACDGTILTTDLHDADRTELRQRITDVRVDGPLVSATVVNSDNHSNAQFPTERSIGLAADCIVDVDVAVTHGTAAQQREAGRATRVTRIMVDKVIEGR
ncbi:sensor domain-containing protein [Mycolicibacterium sp. CBM1]